MKRVTWQDRLAPFAEAYSQLQHEIRDRLTKMTDDEIKKGIAATKRPNDTNCWYCTHDVAPLVAREARFVLNLRRRTKVAKAS